jgi:hypothetical protein
MAAHLYLGTQKRHEKDKPIACVEGGELHGQVLFYSLTPAVENTDFTYQGERDLRIYKSAIASAAGNKRARDGTQFVDIIEEALSLRQPPNEVTGLNDKQRAVYQDIYDDYVKRRRVVLPFGSAYRLIVDPNPQLRQVYYVAGKSGSGKSWIARQLAESYHRFFPSRHIYLFSQLKEDDTLDSMKKSEGKPTRIPLESFLDTPPDVEEAVDALSIFDDYDTVEGDVGKVLRTFIDEIATMGRHKRASMICASHHLTNYSRTRLILSETTHFVVFPQATGKKRLQYLLEAYASMDREEIEGLYGIQSRWVCIGNASPPFLVSEYEARIVAR